MTGRTKSGIIVTKDGADRSVAIEMLRTRNRKWSLDVAGTTGGKLGLGVSRDIYSGVLDLDIGAYLMSPTDVWEAMPGIGLHIGF